MHKRVWGSRDDVPRNIGKNNITCFAHAQHDSFFQYYMHLMTALLGRTAHIFNVHEHGPVAHKGTNRDRQCDVYLVGVSECYDGS